MATEASMDTFRFLGLPKEIRLMVYERLPIIRRHSTLSMPYTPNYSGTSTLVLQVLSLAILRVSKMVHDEAYAMLKPKLYELLSRPPQVIIPAPDLFKIGSGFSKFLQIVREIFAIPCIVTLQSGQMLYYRPGMAYYRRGNIPLTITPSLIQWTKHAGLYFGQMENHPILARFAADNPHPPIRTAGVQLLISQPDMGPNVCTACFSSHLPLQHVLSRFVSGNLNSDYNPKVDLLLLGTTVAALQGGLHCHNPQHLLDVLNLACWWTWPNSIKQKNQGDVLELAAWEEGWQATPGVRISGAPSDEKKMEDEIYSEFIRQHLAEW